MGRTDFYTPKKKEAPWKIHPVWNGIGCVMLFILPVMSYLGAGEILLANETQNWFPIPIELQGPTQYPGLFAQLAVAAVILLFLFLTLVVIYVATYRFFGPSRYGPTDAPPPKNRPRKRRR